MTASGRIFRSDVQVLQQVHQLGVVETASLLHCLGHLSRVSASSLTGSLKLSGRDFPCIDASSASISTGSVWFYKVPEGGEVREGIRNKIESSAVGTMSVGRPQGGDGKDPKTGEHTLVAKAKVSGKLD